MGQTVFLFFKEIYFFFLFCFFVFLFVFLLCLSLYSLYFFLRRFFFFSLFLSPFLFRFLFCFFAFFFLKPQKRSFPQDDFHMWKTSNLRLLCNTLSPLHVYIIIYFHYAFKGSFTKKHETYTFLSYMKRLENFSAFLIIFL